MNEAKRKRIMYAVFILAMLWGLYMQPWKRSERHKPGSTPTEPAAAAVQATVVAQPASDLAIRTATTEWTIDPFRRTGPVDAGDPEEPQAIRNAPVLQGTMTVRGAEVCVIDGQVCQTGDRAGSWKIVKIDNGEVTLAGPNQERVTLNAHDGQRK